MTINRRRYLLAAGLVAFLATATVVVYLTYTETIPPAVANVTTTLLLVLLTGLYAIATYGMVSETRRMADETRRAREQEVRSVVEFHAREMYSEIANIGGGPARNVDLRLELLPEGLTHTVREQSLPAGESISIPVEPFSSIRDREYTELGTDGLDVDWDEYGDHDDIWEDYEHPYQRLSLSGTVEDVWGNVHGVEEEYDVWNLTHEMRGGISTTLDIDDSLHMIATEMRSL